jgi:hypothetical protein
MASYGWCRLVPRCDHANHLPPHNHGIGSTHLHTCSMTAGEELLHWRKARAHQVQQAPTIASWCLRSICMQRCR